MNTGDMEIMEGVTEYSEGRPVGLDVVVRGGAKRLVVVGLVDGTGAEIDLFQLVAWLKKNRPELLV